MCPPRVSKSKSDAFVRALGASIRARRMRMRQTRVELASRSRLSATKIAQVEAGGTDIDLLQLVAIAIALEIPPRRLLSRAEKKVGWKPEGGAERGSALGREGGSSVRPRRQKRKPPR